MNMRQSEHKNKRNALFISTIPSYKARVGAKGWSMEGKTLHTSKLNENKVTDQQITSELIIHPTGTNSRNKLGNQTTERMF